jgi:hypothetical protein
MPPDTRLYSYRARYFDPSVGRFSAEDLSFAPVRSVKFERVLENLLSRTAGAALRAFKRGLGFFQELYL